MNTPIISIIVPVYKVEDYISKCIDSIITQTCKEWECILVDDGSPDGSGKICDEYAARDNRFIVIHKDNEGVTAARRDGVRSAKGIWVVFVDSDDSLPNNSLETLLNNSDGVETVCACVISSNGRKWMHRKSGTMQRDEYINHLIKGDVYGYCYATLYKRNLFDNNVFNVDRSLPIGEDVLMRLELATNSNRIRVINDVVYYYAILENSVMNTKVCSPLYYHRLFERRNQIIHNTIKVDCIKQDLNVLLNSLYSHHVKYDPDYVKVVSNYINDLPTTKSISFKLRLKVLFSNTYLFELYKRFSYSCFKRTNITIID